MSLGRRRTDEHEVISDEWWVDLTNVTVTRTWHVTELDITVMIVDIIIKVFRMLRGHLLND